VPPEEHRDDMQHSAGYGTQQDKLGIITSYNIKVNQTHSYYSG
jgi:hypothetical protein